MPKSPEQEVIEQPIDDGLVAVKITKFGHHQVSSGEHIPAHGDKMLAAGEVVRVDPGTADALEKRGFAEIQ